MGSELDFLAGGGEMAQRIRTFDWEQTPLGPPSTWSTAFGLALVQELVRLHGEGNAFTVSLPFREDLEDSNRRKDEFMATLAHELRNPLAPIRNGLRILKLAADDPVAADEARRMMERQVAHMVRLVDDLMDVSRINRGRIALRLSRVPLSEPLGQALEASRPAIEERGHALVVEKGDDELVLDADATRIAQALGNLLDNAAKYMEPNGRITVTAGREGGTAVVRVRDTGVGIPPAMLPKVFDMFTQVEGILERAQGGLGIGLAIARSLVEMHDGTLTATSEGRGQGSEFTVRLPLAPAVSLGALLDGNHAAPEAVPPPTGVVTP